MENSPQPRWKFRLDLVNYEGQQVGASNVNNTNALLQNLSISRIMEYAVRFVH